MIITFLYHQAQTKTRKARVIIATPSPFPPLFPTTMSFACRYLRVRQPLHHSVLPHHQDLVYRSHVNAQEPPMVFSSANKRKRSATPPVARQVGSGIYHAGRLEKARTVVIEDRGTWIPEIPIEFMLDPILPPVRCDYAAVKRKLKNSKRILKGQWASFPTDSKSSKLHKQGLPSSRTGICRHRQTCS